MGLGDYLIRFLFNSVIMFVHITNKYYIPKIFRSSFCSSDNHYRDLSSRCLLFGFGNVIDVVIDN